VNKKKTLRSYNADYLLSEMSAEKRAEVACKLESQLAWELTDLERELVWAVTRQLAEDAVQLVRQSLSHSVKNCKFLPQDIGLTLAYDIENIAAPFLEVTQIFSEQELCDIANAVSDSVRVAIAGRKDLTAKVSGLLAEIGNLDVAHTLIDNKPAQINESGFSTLSSRFSQDASLFEKMATRADLTPAIVTNLIMRVSDSARQQLESRYSMMPDFMNVLAQDSQTNTLLKLADSSSAADAVSYARELYEKGQLTHTFCLLAIRNGNLPFFEAAMAVRTGITVENVQRILRDGGFEATGKLCAKARIPSFMHAEIVESFDSRLQTDIGSPAPLL
jgi:uncharacterized protein (DUF2336 family)